MNFLMRSTCTESERSSSLSLSLSSETHFDPHSQYSTPLLSNHLDVSHHQGCITIPYKELPQNWNHVSDIHSLDLDRSFLFPGEQVQILACLSASKHDAEITTPFKLAALMSTDAKGHSPHIENRQLSISSQEPKEDHPPDVFYGESILRMEIHKRQTASLLQNFDNSHFFIRISESDEPLCSKRGSSENFPNSSETNAEMASTLGFKETEKNMPSISAVIDRGNFDATTSGGVARKSVKSCALPNGDIVVILQVNVGVHFLRDPCIEILQYEKYPEKLLSSENEDYSVYKSSDPCRELLKWILPLHNNTLPPPSPRPLTPPTPNLPSNSGTGTTSQKSNLSASSGSQLFSFGNFRSYSMSSLPQTTSTPTGPLKAASSKPNFEIDDWDQISSQKFLRNKSGNELLSFRGVSLEGERFSVCCGLEGTYTPGRRWRRKVKIIQPVEIHSFAADCNSEDLLCVQIKNVAPSHAPDIVIFIDAITIVLDEATKSGKLSSLPIACIEAGNDHSLPNLALRRGEEHSFILKPTTSMYKNLKVEEERSSQLSKLQFGNSASKLNLSSKSPDKGENALGGDDQYAVMVSCRCNYTASRLFFKQPISWQPRTSRDILITVASEMSGESPRPYQRNSPLPVQVLTLRASNLTSEDLTLTVLAPASFTSPPSVVSLSSPTTMMSPFIGFTGFLGRANSDHYIGATQPRSFTSHVKQNEKQSDDVIPSSGRSCTHLWLQSRVPLGCVPSQSTASIKLELLPLTDGIITLDSLQIGVKEKGVTYIPECSLKINGTSTISKGII
ncbi:hypothetical protein Lalb_Chr09g0335271 [Lupinus albus]|uniref:Uncharacterized protein n=1 Tax=Lupinus albus TaxID=3870 RepID=A0A6A4Q270_LUPAL|nr:hypothetical protein Lalb_Chr09g0335271 [Lupinus albus]